ncbi:MAG: anti-sigma F factor [Clostridiales bacterium]|nr:anti-sigma F factor [Clostridiales bacterium]
MEYNNYMKVEFESKSHNEAFGRVVVAAFVAQLDPTIEEITDIKTAVSEAVTNAIIHVYENKIGLITIVVVIKGKEIEIDVSDNGKGIENVAKAMEPLYTSKPELERSGIGFTVMETFMDVVKVYSKVGEGTRIRLSKRIEKFDSEVREVK